MAFYCFVVPSWHLQRQCHEKKKVQFKKFFSKRLFLDGLATLNTQWRVSVGAAFNALHSALSTTSHHPHQQHQQQQLMYPSQLQQQRRRRRRHSRVFDEFHGRIAGVNFNGLRVLDAYAHGWHFFSLAFFL